MKRTIYFLIVAMFSVLTLNAQDVKKSYYVIDGKVVDNFDGSQLVGATINSYSCDMSKNLHIIFTTQYTKDVDEKKKDLANALESLVNTGAFLKGEVKDVKVLSIGKNDNSENVLNNVKSSSSKQAEEGETIYVVNGKIVTYSEIKDIQPSKIVSVTVIKDKNNPDYIKYTKDAIKYAKLDPKCIVNITTK